MRVVHRERARAADRSVAGAADRGPYCEEDATSVRPVADASGSSSDECLMPRGPARRHPVPTDARPHNSATCVPGSYSGASFATDIGRNRRTFPGARRTRWYVSPSGVPPAGKGDIHGSQGVPQERVWAGRVRMRPEPPRRCGPAASGRALGRGPAAGVRPLSAREAARVHGRRRAGGGLRGDPREDRPRVRQGGPAPREVQGRPGGLLRRGQEELGHRLHVGQGEGHRHRRGGRRRLRLPAGRR